MKIAFYKLGCYVYLRKESIIDNIIPFSTIKSTPNLLLDNLFNAQPHAYLAGI